jgi:hypothetical protein
MDFTYSSNGNYGASRKQLKLRQLTKAAIGEVRQNWRTLYKAAVDGTAFLMRSCYSSTFLNDDLKDFAYSTMFLANAMR